MAGVLAFVGLLLPLLLVMVVAAIVIVVAGGVDALEDPAVVEARIDAVFDSVLFRVIGDLIELQIVLLGGYIAGRVAKTEEIRYGSYVGATVVVLELILHFTLRAVLPDFDPIDRQDIIYFLAAPGAGMAGGALAMRRRLRKLRAASPN